MLRFNLNDNAVRLPNPHDPIFQLEAQVDQIRNPKQRLALLYNDAKNYETGKIPPFEAWYEKRIRIIQEYAALDWLALGEHLGTQSHCQAIHTWLGLLLEPKEPVFDLAKSPVFDLAKSPVFDLAKSPVFDLALFCRVLGKIDHLWHTLLPSHLSNIENSTVKTLLAYFEVQYS